MGKRLPLIAVWAIANDGTVSGLEYKRPYTYYVHVTPDGAVRYNRPATETRTMSAGLNGDGLFSVWESRRFDFHDKHGKFDDHCKLHERHLTEAEAMQLMESHMYSWQCSGLSTDLKDAVTLEEMHRRHIARRAP